MPGDDAGSGDEVLAALVTALRRELAESQAALARALEALALAPLRAKGSPENDKPWSIHGRLAGFAILWDRDKDGTTRRLLTPGLLRRGAARASHGGCWTRAGRGSLPGRSRDR